MQARRRLGRAAAVTSLVLAAMATGLVVQPMAPAGAATTAVIVNTNNDAWLALKNMGGEGAGWQERTGEVNLLVRHAASESVTGVKMDLDDSSSYNAVNTGDVGGGNACESGACGRETRTGGTGYTVTRLGAGLSTPTTTTGQVFSLVTFRATFSDLSGWSNSDRQRERTARATVTMSTGDDAPTVTAKYWTTSNGNNTGGGCVSCPEDYGHPENIPDLPNDLLYYPGQAVSGSSDQRSPRFSCDDPDSSGENDCNDMDYRFRRITDGALSPLQYYDVSGDNGTEDGPFYLPFQTGRWIMEGRFGDGVDWEPGVNCEDSSVNSCFFAIQVFTIDDVADPSTPTLGVSTNRPNTGSSVTLTPGNLVDPKAIFSNTTWTARYYNAANNDAGPRDNCIPAASSDGSPTATAQIALPYNDFGSGGPGSPVTTDNFCARYKLPFTAGYTGTLKMAASTDDGGRAFITPAGGTRTQLYSNWSNHGTDTQNFSTNITAGTTYLLEFEYYERTSGALARFWFQAFNTGSVGPINLTADQDVSGIQVVDFDTTDDGTYDNRYTATSTGTTPYTGFTSTPTQVVNTTGMTPGLKTARVRVCDNGAALCGYWSGSASATTTYLVNSAPSAATASATVQRGAANSVTFSIAASDANGFTGNAAGTTPGKDENMGAPVFAGSVPGTVTCGAFVPASGNSTSGSYLCTWTGVPANTSVGTRTITATVSDSHGATSAPVNINLTVSNTAPSALDQSVFATAGSPTAINLTGSDVNGDVLAYAATSSPAKGSLSCSNAGACTYTPTASASGGDSFTFTTNDDTATSAPAGVVTINIRRVTATALSCTNPTLAYDSVASCTVTVTDTGPSPLTPSGAVSLAATGSPGTATFSSCTLAQVSVGVASCAVTFTVNLQDSYSVTAGKVLDGAWVASTSSPVSVKFGPHATSTVVSCSPSSLVAGSPSSCTATVTDTQVGVTKASPSGTVVFGQSGGGTFSSTTCALSAGATPTSTCTVQFTPTFGGAKTVTASFDGFSSGAAAGGFKHRSSSAVPVPLTVSGSSSQHPTTTSVSCSPNPVQVSTATTCTAIVTDTMTFAATATPTGTVNFAYSGGGALSPTSCTLTTNVVNVSAKCSVTFTPNAIAGSKTVQANYAGVPVLFKASGSGSVFVTATAAPVTPSTPQVQHPTTTSVTCSPSTLPLGNASTCTVTVTDAYDGTTSSPAGTVSVGSSGGGTLSAPTCTLQPSGNGVTSTCQVTFTPTGAKGSKTVIASYAGTPQAHKASGSGSFYLNAT